MTSTNGAQKKNVDIQITRFIYASKSSFSTVEQREFVKIVQRLRPGYKTPSRHDIGGGVPFGQCTWLSHERLSCQFKWLKCVNSAGWMEQSQ